jgi:hypothetical protein
VARGRRSAVGWLEVDSDAPAGAQQAEHRACDAYPSSRTSRAQYHPSSITRLWASRAIHRELTHTRCIPFAASTSVKGSMRQERKPEPG